jgi:CRP/FNR family transcriptional regulator
LRHQVQADAEETPMPTPHAASHSRLALQPVISSTQPADLEQRLAQASLRRVEAKEFVFAEGDPTTHIFQVETGAVALYKILSDGRRQVVGFAYPGDLIGLGAEGEHVMNAQAIKPTRLRCLPVGALNQMARQDARLGFKLYEALARELAATRAFLLAFARRNERSGKDACAFDLPMTRADIADFLGLTIETVSRTFTKLKVQGVIELPQSSHVHILDLEALKCMEGGEENA